MLNDTTRRLNRLADQILISGRIEDAFESAWGDAGPQKSGTSLLGGGAALDVWGVARNAPELVRAILDKAAAEGASDIHIEPGRENTMLRFRVDGILHHVTDLPADRSLEFISRLKVLCNMDIAEKRRPQDGRFRFSMGDRDIDVRVSTVPTEAGEKMVLRLLDQDQLAPELEELGLDHRDQGIVLETIGRTQGMLLVTGPTGSGKTTTLYSCLRRIRNPRLNIMTIEDPIEYRLDGINQSQAKLDIGYTFAGALRSFLRQDPNVIMVGEIRDSETAQIALRAAMTGHLVLSTVHTNDAASTITRLLDLGAEPYLVASSVSLIVAQRLVRRLCPDCSRPAESGPQGTLRAVGCPACNHTGYRGRVGVFEVLKVDPAIQELIHARAPSEHIRELAKANGMRHLVEDAREKWLHAMTTLDEIEREVGATEPIMAGSLSKSTGSARSPSTSI